MQSLLDAISLVAERAERVGQGLTPDAAQEYGPEELNAAVLMLLHAADTCEQISASMRECPGTYWRTAPPKRGRTASCGHGAPAFKRAALGPMRADGTGGSLVCDACAQALRRDAAETPSLVQLFSEDL